MANAILSIDHVTVSFDGFMVLDGLNFAMGYGELRFLNMSVQENLLMGLGRTHSADFCC